MTPTSSMTIGEAEQAQWEDDCLEWRGRVLTGKAAHYCHDWDGLPVDETTDEIDGCHCILVEGAADE